MTLPPPRNLNADLLRYFLDVYRCAKIVGGPADIAVSTFSGGVAVGELGADECRTFTSLEAALRDYAVSPGQSLADLIAIQTTKVHPPEAEE